MGSAPAPGAVFRALAENRERTEKFRVSRITRTPHGWIRGRIQRRPGRPPPRRFDATRAPIPVFGLIGTHLSYLVSLISKSNWKKRPGVVSQKITLQPIGHRPRPRPRRRIIPITRTTRSKAVHAKEALAIPHLGGGSHRAIIAAVYGGLDLFHGGGGFFHVMAMRPEFFVAFFQPLGSGQRQYFVKMLEQMLF